MTNDIKTQVAEEMSSRVSEFLTAVETKTDDKIHLRLLRACRKGNSVDVMESELRLIVEEVFP